MVKVSFSKIPFYNNRLMIFKDNKHKVKMLLSDSCKYYMGQQLSGQDGRSDRQLQRVRWVVQVSQL